MKILILGGTGAMGTPLIENLLDSRKGCSIYVTSRQVKKNSESNLTWITGNARNLDFFDSIISDFGHFDVIIDFMNYDLEEFRQRSPRILNVCGQYIWFSSSRVYSPSKGRLNESSSRLLETSDDKDFLATNRYALRKARQEDILTNSGFDNFTIIRPYITYNDNRLQVGVYEKEHWLYRILMGRPLVISKSILNKRTTLTYGKDVADYLVPLIGMEKAKGQIFQIAGPETITWRKLLRLYSDIIFEYTGTQPVIYAADNIGSIEMLWEGGYNTIYDRIYDREFNSEKIEEFTNLHKSYTSIKDGIGTCLMNFLGSPRRFLSLSPENEAYQDYLTGCKTELSEFSTEEERKRYIETYSSAESEISDALHSLTRIF